MVTGARAGLAALILVGLSAAAEPDPELLAEAVRSDPALAGIPLADLATALTDEGPDPSPAPVRGDLLVRVGGGPGRRPDTLLRTDLRHRGLRLRVRHRALREGDPVTGACLEAGAGPLRIAAGGLGVQAGNGLLTAAPGRSAGHTLDGPFRPPRTRVTGWTLAGDRRAFDGAALAAVHRAARATLYGGRTAETVPRDVRGALLELGGSDRSVGAQVQVRGRERGVGVWWRAGRGGARLDGEAIRWQARPGTPWHGAASLAFLWRPVPRWEVRSAVAAGTDGPGPAAGRPTPEMGAWTGRGWSLAVVWRPRRGVRYGLLAARGRHRPDPLAADREDTRTLEMAAAGPGPGGGRLQARLRWRRQQRWAWSADRPWQPAASGPPAHRTSVSLQYRLARPRGAARLRLGAHHRAGTGTNGLRCLAGLDGSLRLTPTFHARGALVLAWGDPVDLLGAVTPVPGLVVPRHWGRWSAERMAGVQAVRGRWRLGAGVTVRTPDSRVGGPESVQAWVDVRHVW